MRLILVLISALGVEVLFLFTIFCWAVAVGALCSFYQRRSTERHFEGEE